MDYNDFQILSSDEYKILNEHFNNSSSFNRRTSIHQIYSLLVECRSYCISIDKNLNKKIKDSIFYCHQTLGKLISNFEATFNLQNNTNLNSSFQIFTFLQKLLQCESLLLQWLNNEDKEYYKKFINSTIIEINQSATYILAAISKSNIILFKYM